MSRPALTRRLSAPALLAPALISLALIVGPALLAPASLAAAAKPRPSITTIERQVMCVTCKIPLNVAESPQADRERAFIQTLIDQGRSEDQIKEALVDQYGEAVLGLPGTSGFDLTVYLVPVAVVAVLVGLLLLLLPRWRRRAAAAAGASGSAAGPPLPPVELTPADRARLESDMARFD